MRGIGMQGNPFVGEEVCQRRYQYFNWLTSRVFDRPYASDPEVVKAIAKELHERLPNM